MTPGSGLATARAIIDEEMQVVERSFAYQCAVWTLEMFCPELHVIGEGSFSLDTSEMAPDEAELVAEAVRYLEWRRLLVRLDSAIPSCVVLDKEDEAQLPPALRVVPSPPAE